MYAFKENVNYRSKYEEIFIIISVKRPLKRELNLNGK